MSAAPSLGTPHSRIYLFVTPLFFFIGSLTLKPKTTNSLQVCNMHSQHASPVLAAGDIFSLVRVGCILQSGLGDKESPLKTSYGSRLGAGQRSGALHGRRHGESGPAPPPHTTCRSGITERWGLWQPAQLCHHTVPARDSGR